MKKVTYPADWELKLYEVESFGYGEVRLLVDGYNVTYQFTRTSKNKLVFIFFVDGYWKGEYSNPNSEIGKRFGMERKMRMPKVHIALLRFNYSKKQIAEKVKEYNRQVAAYFQSHNSAKSLIASLKKNNVSITLKSNDDASEPY
jgi:hypothetical protein